MKTLAAVLIETGKPLELAELSIPALRPGQMLVEIAFSGVCHTQVLEARGHRGDDPYLPHCLGHEASGTVIDVGPEVTKCRPGDRVILSWIKGSGADVPGTIYDWNGRAVNAGGVTTFAQHSVVSENRVTVLSSPETKLDSAIAMAGAALIGCAVATGAGAIFNAARVQPGNSVALFGVGGIGLCAIMAARVAQASPIIAVDINSQRLKVAKQVGATNVIDASTTDATDGIQEVCPGGLDFAIEASGRPAVMQQALACVRPRGGTAIVIGNARFGERLEIDPRQLNQGKRLLGTWGGDTQPDGDFPRYVDLVAAKQIDLSPLLSNTYALSEINTALDDLESGRVIRPLIKVASD